MVSFWDLHENAIYTSTSHDAQQQYLYPQMKTEPHNQQEFKDDIIGLTWNLKGNWDKDKFYVYLKNGLIEESPYT